MQAVINAILYILCAGCAWRMLPSDFPHWKTLYHYFRAWRVDGTWERINHKLHQWVRVNDNREISPSAAIVDSQSVKTATPGAIAVGYDSAKQIKGRKRHLLVDTLVNFDPSSLLRDGSSSATIEAAFEELGGSYERQGSNSRNFL